MSLSLINHPELKNLGDAPKQKAIMLEKLMREIEQAEKVWPACQAIAARCQSTGQQRGMSAERLKKKFYAWKAEGWTALIDHNLCGGCQLPGCTRETRCMLAEETLQYWRSLAESNDRSAHKAARRRLIRELRNGNKLAGLPGDGTWRGLWRELYPLKAMPAACPWDSINHPPGWSESSFLQKQSPKSHQALAKKGLGAAKPLIHQIRRDTSGLLCMQYVAFDDVRLDFKIVHNGEICEIWCLFAMDVATRCIVAYALRPVPIRARAGNSLTRRDLRHLITGMFDTHGIPKDYTTTLLVENASAAIEKPDEDVLSMVFGGRVLVDRTGMISADVFRQGFIEKGGNPRGKSWLEVFFSSLHTELGWMLGQTGSIYTKKAGSLDARLSWTQKLLNVQEQALATGASMVMPLNNFSQAWEAVAEVVDLLNMRTQHTIKGFDRVSEWRYGEADPIWKPVGNGDAEDLHVVFPDQQLAATIFARNGRTRAEMPLERWTRLHTRTEWERVPKGALIEMLLDSSKPFTYRGANTVKFKLDGALHDFCGFDHKMIEGKTYSFRWMRDRPGAGIFLRDELGRYMGWMPPATGINPLDRAALERELGVQNHQVRKTIDEVRKRHWTPEFRGNALTAGAQNLIAGEAILNETGIARAITAGSGTLDRVPAASATEVPDAEEEMSAAELRSRARDEAWRATEAARDGADLMEIV